MAIFTIILPFNHFVFFLILSLLQRDLHLLTVDISLCITSSSYSLSVATLLAYSIYVSYVTLYFLYMYIHIIIIHI